MGFITERELEYDKIVNEFLSKRLKHIHNLQNNVLLLVTKYRRELNLTLDDVRYLFQRLAFIDQSHIDSYYFWAFVEINQINYFRDLGEKYTRNPYISSGMLNLATSFYYSKENRFPEKFRCLKLCWSRYDSIEYACELKIKLDAMGNYEYQNYLKNVWYKEYCDQFLNACLDFKKAYDQIKKCLGCFEKENILIKHQ